MPLKKHLAYVYVSNQSSYHFIALCENDAYGDNGFRLTGEVERAVAQENDWPESRSEEHTLAKINPATLHAYTGVYLFGGQFKFIIAQKSGTLYVQYAPFGEEPQELLPESDTNFFMTSQPFVIDFQKESDGSIRKAKA